MPSAVRAGRTRTRTAVGSTATPQMDRPVARSDGGAAAHFDESAPHLVVAGEGSIEHDKGVPHELVVTDSVRLPTLRFPAVEQVVAYPTHEEEHVDCTAGVPLGIHVRPGEVVALLSWGIAHESLNGRSEDIIDGSTLPEGFHDPVRKAVPVGLGRAVLLLSDARRLERVLEPGKRREEREYQLAIEVVTEMRFADESEVTHRAQSTPVTFTVLTLAAQLSSPGAA